MELFFWKGTGDDNWAAFPGDGRLLLQCGLMTNEQDLRQLIRHMRPEAHPGRYVFAVVPGPVPDEGRAEALDVLRALSRGTR